ncbi:MULTISPECIES: hypothetical protein [Paracoccaceae]|jgi:hypothetical protein|uniref:hypothetical protein n=1 Tax=Rhodobacterales TaxID=204455 RepID=UPI001B00F2FE|nr:hypothetical protein [Boseongicola sp. H5]MBO6602425.1 hypothetical protein [Roseicyclus sp.]MBO6625959.1 hypothetical protein [Roseicyclus sp.]MBO6920595.1 hypothetical protein [Roseicyclus sp.]
MRLLSIILALIGCWQPALGQQEEDRLSLMAFHAFNGFQCSELAAGFGDEETAATLFDLGYSSVLSLAAELDVNELDISDIGGPAILSTLWVGPTTDFTAGRVYEAARQFVRREVREILGRDWFDEGRRASTSRFLYAGMSCEDLINA